MMVIAVGIALVNVQHGCFGIEAEESRTQSAPRPTASGQSPELFPGRYWRVRPSPTRTTIDPLRLVAFTSGPPPEMSPTAVRFVTAPCTDAPITLTDPDPLLRSRANRADPAASMSMPPDPLDTIQSRCGSP